MNLSYPFLIPGYSLYHLNAAGYKIPGLTIGNKYLIIPEIITLKKAAYMEHLFQAMTYYMVKI
jgi:hypothetical protein